jgi:hypothetical protein
MDIFIEARVSRALISVNNAHMRRCLLRQYHTQGTYKIADRPATDGSMRLEFLRRRFSRTRRLIVATRRTPRPAGCRLVKAAD